MTIDEDTGEDVVCPVCDAIEFWNCGHLIASFDRSFGECQGGLIYDSIKRFLSIVEIAFLSHLKDGSAPNLNHGALSDLWNEAKSNFDPNDEDYVHIDDYIFQGYLIELLQDSGGLDAPGSLIDPGGPGMTSSMSLIFSENPSDVIENALQRLSMELKKSGGSARE